jgi:hypothetical protein
MRMILYETRHVIRLGQRLRAGSEPAPDCKR